MHHGAGKAEIYLRPCSIYGDRLTWTLRPGAVRRGLFVFGFLGGFEWIRFELDLATGALALLASSRPASPRLLGLLAGLLALWVLTALARAQYGEAGASRYVYPSAVLLVLVFGEALAGRRLPRPWRPAVAGLILLAVGGGLAALERGAGGLRQVTAAAAPRLAALEIAGVSAAPGYQPDVGREPQVTAGPYL